MRIKHIANQRILCFGLKLSLYLSLSASLLFSVNVHAEWLALQGHLKLQAHSYDQQTLGLLDGRLKTDYQPEHPDHSAWRFRADYQIQSVISDDLAPINPQASRPIPNDKAQVFDLSHTLLNEKQTLALHKLDRLVVSYTQTNYSLHIGRQAFSWGQGYVFNPLDLFNPFAPNAWDTEYKPGSDMLHAQWLMDSGDDVSFLAVPRRNINNGKIETNQSSYAAFWRHYAQIETHIMLAQDYQDTVLGLSFNGHWLDGQWKLDLMPSWLDDGQTKLSGLIAYHQAWSWLEHNFNGFIEGFYNGFGEPKAQSSQLNKPLTERLMRGQVFTQNRHYLSLGSTMEITPLTSASVTLLHNLDDSSQLWMLNTNYSLSDHQQLIGGLQQGLGNKNSEFNTPTHAYLQWARYF